MRVIPVNVFIMALLLLVASCEEESVKRDYPRVRTLEVTNITENGATFVAEVYEEGHVEITEHGFTWSMQNPDIQTSNRIQLGRFSGTGDFSAEILTTLEEGKKYNICAFVKAGDYTVYGNRIEFTSLGSQGPVITGFSPGRALCGDTILIRGRNFSWVKTSNVVRFNNVTAEVCAPVTDTVLKVVVPFTISASENTISVEIAGNRTSYTQATLTVDLPVIESFSPVAGHWGDTIEILFRNLRKVDNLQFLLGHLHIVPIEPYDGRSVRIIVPLAADLDFMTISFSAGGGSFPSDDQFALLPPSIYSFSPVIGYWPDTVTVYGIFNPTRQQTVVLFGSYPGSVLSVTRDSLKVIVPEGLIESPVGITYRYGRFESASAQKFALLPPRIDNVTPMTEFAGGYVTITGNYFLKDYTTVRFNDEVAKVVNVGRNQIYCEAAGNISGETELKVTVSDRTTAYTVPFVLTNPEVVSFYPETASPGDIITVTCKNFNSSTWLRLSPSGIGMEILSVNGNVVRAMVPSGDYTSGHVGAFVYRNYTESLISSDGLLTVPEPEITSVTPLSGTKGTMVTVTGRNFSTVSEFNKITFFGVEVPVISSSRTQITFLMPLAPGGVDRITLRVCGHQVYSSDEFENHSAWSRLPDLPMNDATCMMDFGDEILMTAPSDNPTMTVYRFDPVTSIFSPVGNVNTSILSFEKSVVKGDNAYLIGSTYEESFMMAFNRINMSFSTITPAPGGLRMGTFLIDGDSVLYAGGGGERYYSGRVRELWKYRMSSGNWYRLNDLPFETVGSNGFTVNGRFYVIDTNQNLWEYLQGSDSWEPRPAYPAYPEPYVDFRMITVCNGKVYCGYGSIVGQNVYAYDPSSNSWSALTDEQPGPRYRPLSFEYGGKVYIGSGQDSGTPLTDLWVYDPAKETGK